MDETLLDLIAGNPELALASPGLALAQPGQALVLPANHPLLLVILGPYAAAQAMLTLTAYLARGGPLQVLDGGNRFNAYIVARQLRRLMQAGRDQAEVPDLRQCLDRIRVARAFTCYQMAALIDQTSIQGSPTLVIDLLDTFYDESAPLEERRRLAEHCMRRLRQTLSRPDGSLSEQSQEQAPANRPDPAPPYSRGPVVVVSLRPPPPGQADPTGLQELVQAAADRVLIQEGPVPANSRELVPANRPGAAPNQKPRWHSQSGPWPGRESLQQSRGESWHSQDEQPKLF